jgi:hypothetical protein
MCDRLPTAVLSLLFTYLDVASGARLQCSHTLVAIARLPSSAPVHYEIVGARHFEKHHYWRLPAIPLLPQSFTDRGWTRTRDSLRRFASNRLQTLDIFVAYAFDALVLLTTVTDLTLRVTGYKYYMDNEGDCLLRLSELKHVRRLAIVGGEPTADNAPRRMGVGLAPFSARLEHLDLSQQGTVRFDFAHWHLALSRLGALRSLGLPCRDFHAQLVAAISTHAPQIAELILGECTEKTAANLTGVSRLAALRSLTLVRFAFSRDANRDSVDEGNLAERAISASVACTKLERLNLTAFAPPPSAPSTASTHAPATAASPSQSAVSPIVTQMNLCALGDLMHLRALTLRDCPRLVYVLAAAPASPHVLDFRVTTSSLTNAQAPFVVCYRSNGWNGVSCVAPSGEIRIRS